MCRQWMHKYGILLSQRQELIIHLITAKNPTSLFRLSLLAHARPDIGVNYIGITGRFRWLLENMSLSSQCPYGFPLNLPLGDVPAKKPQEWLGVQWLPLSPHSYASATAIITRQMSVNVPSHTTVGT